MGVLGKIWRTLSGEAETPARKFPEVIVHDPALRRPHDLDDPFLDPHLQQRMGEAIAKVTEHKLPDKK